MCLGGSNTLMHFLGFRKYFEVRTYGLVSAYLGYTLSKFLMLFGHSGVSDERTGITVEGFASAVEEPVATPPVTDSKVNIRTSIFISISAFKGYFDNIYMILLNIFEEVKCAFKKKFHVTSNTGNIFTFKS